MNTPRALGPLSGDRRAAFTAAGREGCLNDVANDLRTQLGPQRAILLAVGLEVDGPAVPGVGLNLLPDQGYDVSHAGFPRAPNAHETHKFRMTSAETVPVNADSSSRDTNLLYFQSE